MQARKILKEISAAIIAASIFFSQVLLAAVEVKVHGISGALKKNVELTVGVPVNDKESNIAGFIKNLKSQTTQSLQALGYYNSTVSIKRDKQKRKTESVSIININVQSGPAVHIQSLDVVIEGVAGHDSVFKKIIQQLPLKEGDVLNHGLYEKTKNLLLDTAQDRGYFDAQFYEKSVQVDKLQNTARIKLGFDSGQRYKFGDIQIDSDIFDKEFLMRWVPFNPGADYESRLVVDLTQQFQASGYFTSVRVRTLRDQAVDGKVPVVVKLRASPDNNIGLGLGFATDTGPRTKFTWRRPHNNSLGHSIDVISGISEIRQEASIQYKIPRQHRPLTDYWLADFGALNEETEDAESQLRTLNFQRVRQTSEFWQESVFIRWEHEKFVAADENGTINLLLPGVSWSRTKSRGGLIPSWGNQFSVQFMGGSTAAFSDINLLRSVLSLKWLRTLYTKHKLILSLEYGAITSNDFDRLPTSHRFYVGGDRSVRGFRYRTISPEDDEGNLLGGRFKEVGSIEYDYAFKEKWSLATFIDAGRAFDKFDERYRVGTGIGIRWHSPVGPLRLDLGVGISEEDTPILFHMSLGPDL